MLTINALDGTAAVIGIEGRSTSMEEMAIDESVEETAVI